MQFYGILDRSNGGCYSAEPSPYPKGLESFVLGEQDPPQHISYNIKHGRKAGDVLSDAAWSERMVTALKDLGATGFAAYRVSVSRKGEPVTGYVGVRVTGRGGPRIPGARRLLTKGQWFDLYQGIYMQEDAWDGSDVFSIPGAGIGLFVVERVADVLRKLRLRGVMLVPNDEYMYTEKCAP